MRLESESSISFSDREVWLAIQQEVQELLAAYLAPPASPMCVSLRNFE